MDPAHEWTGRTATALRKALRLTNERFAARLGVAPRTVVNWAAHPDTVPRAAIQEALDELHTRAAPSARHRFEQLGDAEAPSDHVQALRVAIAVVVHGERVLLVRRRDEASGISWQFPAGIIKPSERGEDVAVRETFAETGIHCSLTERIGSRLHPVTGVMCDYYWCEYLAGDATNLDTIENAGVAWAPRRDLTRFVPRDHIYPPVLAMLEESYAAGA
ncbi:NUDIX domain-containing protein [Spirillospora sp. NBC_01491]|uniref:NUDIX domain-containing protein n=1 Tax=Spirillospora sp. NBC_01491 TaxID=2976007 RepID=UPI002E342882|nr:NUDIX domain-containing protein [Spirillospora sp. NBC_01491]